MRIILYFPITCHIVCNETTFKKSHNFCLQSLFYESIIYLFCPEDIMLYLIYVSYHNNVKIHNFPLKDKTLLGVYMNDKLLNWFSFLLMIRILRWSWKKSKPWVRIHKFTTVLKEKIRESALKYLLQKRGGKGK